MRTGFYTIITTAAIIAPTWATPATLDGTIIEVCVRNGQQAFAEMDEEPTDWAECKHSSLYLHFPTNANNTYSYQLYKSTEDSPWPPVVVTYHPQDSAITITGNDMHVDIQLSFSSATSGNADIAWHEEGGSWYGKGQEMGSAGQCFGRQYDADPVGLSDGRADGHGLCAFL